MAPINRYDHDALEQQLKDTIQSLYQILVQVSAYDTSTTSTTSSPAPASTGTPNIRPSSSSTTAATTTASREVLSAEFSALSNSLRAINSATALNFNPHDPNSSATNPSGPGAQLPMIPPELIQYVENGRNPDIYTREFVELVRRGNQLIKGKRMAFAGFRDVLANEIRGAMPELAGDVEKVMNPAAGGGGGPGAGTGEVKKEE